MQSERQRARRLAGSAILLIAAAAIAGCAAGAGVQPANYDRLPGSGDHMAAGPGVFHAGQDQDYHGGYTVFSNNPEHKALINPARRQASHDQAASAVSGSSSATDQEQAFRQFRAYQQFKQFQSMPANSPERRKFREWQQWKQYEQWKNGGSGGQ